MMTREQIERAFVALDAELSRRGARVECYVVRGAAMCLALDARDATKDVDAWFTEPEVVRAATRRVAEDLGLADDWLNDAAKGYIPAGAGFEQFRAYSHLSVSIADETTLLAMKVIAARACTDAADISPAPFKIRRVFVPRNYLSRA